jgi:hypothetical protein
MTMRPNDFVECLEDDKAAGLELRGVYRIAEIWTDAAFDGCGTHGDECDGVGVILTTVTLNDEAECFCSKRFRLLYRPDPDLFKRLAMPVRRNEFTIQTKKRP